MNTKPLALITGGTSGIGFSIAKRLSEKYDLALIYKSNEEKSRVAKETIKDVRCYKCDITNYELLAKTYGQIKNDFKRSPKVLVNSAGVASRNLFSQESVTSIKSIIDINLLGTMFMTQLVLKDMYSTKVGKIINLSSIAGQGGYVGMSVYGASKAGLDAFTRSLVAEVGHRNIQINTIRPGLVETEMTRTTVEETSKLVGGLKKNQGINAPYGEYIKPEAISEMVFFLVEAPHTQAINGSEISIDGGSSIFRNQIKLSDYD